jgi:hypothetical protein
LIRKDDLISLIMSDLVDLTEDSFNVIQASDDSGNHIEVQVENHDDASKIRKFFDKTGYQKRIIILKVPPGYLA